MSRSRGRRVVRDGAARCSLARRAGHGGGRARLAGLACAPEGDAPAAVRPISGRLFPPGEALRVLWSPDRARRASAARARRLPGAARRLAPPRRFPTCHCRFTRSSPPAAATCTTMRTSATPTPPPGRRSRSRHRLENAGLRRLRTLAFDRAGRIVAVYSNGRRFELEWMDPWTLEELASYPLPDRSWSFLLQGVLPWEYIGAGHVFLSRRARSRRGPHHRRPRARDPDAGARRDAGLHAGPRVRSLRARRGAAVAAAGQHRVGDARVERTPRLVRDHRRRRGHHRPRERRGGEAPARWERSSRTRSPWERKASS